MSNINDKSKITHGRWPWDLSRSIDMATNQKAQIIVSDRLAFDAVYLGRTKQSPLIMERFFCPDAMNIPLNLVVTVKSGKKHIGSFLLATIRPDEDTILLIKEENLPCPD